MGNLALGKKEREREVVKERGEKGRRWKLKWREKKRDIMKRVGR